MSLDYVRNKRGLTFIKKGMKVENTYLKKVGIVKSGNISGNLNVLFNGEKKQRNCHPTWSMKYFDENNNIIAEYGE